MSLFQNIFVPPNKSDDVKNRKVTVHRKDRIQYQIGVYYFFSPVFSKRFLKRSTRPPRASTCFFPV